MSVPADEKACLVWARKTRRTRITRNTRTTRNARITRNTRMLE